MNRFEEFSERLSELMEINGETVKSLSQKSGIADASIYAYLKNKNIPDIKNAVLIADCFLCPLNYLFGFCDEYVKKERGVVETINTRIRLAIDNSGKTRYRIAKDANIEQQAVYRWYHGKLTPTLVSLVKLVEPLGCSLDYLAGREE